MTGRRATTRHPTGVELVALVGGPHDGRDGRWLTAAAWERDLVAARWHLDKHPGDGPDHAAVSALRYRETGEWVANPGPVQWPQGGTVWRWQRRPADE